MKQYFLPQIFSFFIITFSIAFTRAEKKCLNVTDDDIWNRKTKFKAKSQIMKSNRNYKKVDTKISRVLKCKEIVWIVKSTVWILKSLFSQIIRIWKLPFRSVKTYFSCKRLRLQRTPLFRLVETSLFYLSVNPW